MIYFPFVIGLNTDDTGDIFNEKVLKFWKSICMKEVYRDVKKEGLANMIWWKSDISGSFLKNWKENEHKANKKELNNSYWTLVSSLSRYTMFWLIFVNIYLTVG